MGKKKRKQVTEEIKLGTKGESFFKSLICDHAIARQAIGFDDVGIDYFCEWLKGTRPSGHLFAVQIKTLSKGKAAIIPIRRRKKYDANKLPVRDIPWKTKNRRLYIGKPTLNYWKDLGMPVFLFVIVETKKKIKEWPNFDCYYKRYTPELTTDVDSKINLFYKVNNGLSFHAFKSDDKKNKYGFCRDLYIDLVRCRYASGFLTMIDPRDLGLEQFDKKKFFSDLFKEYKKSICKAYINTKRFLDKEGINCTKETI